MDKLRKFSPPLLRTCIALVFLWVGCNQIIDPNSWIAYIPDWVISLSGLSALIVVYLNGVFEIVFGTALFLGFFTEIVSFVLMLHMIDITYTVGLDSIGVRDFGLAAATVVVWLNGPDFLSLDRYMKGGIKQEAVSAPLKPTITFGPQV